MIEGTFDVVGAAAPTAFFEHLTRTTLAHGYLFAGPPGTGKRTFALRLAQSLLCTTPKTTLLGYCGTCGACTRVVAGVHPDLLVADGQVKIGDRDARGDEDPNARELVRRLSMHGYAGGMRVAILADAEFTREAANALLAFFEEPPDGVVLVVTTTVPGRLLATIRSRLVDVRFLPLGDDDVRIILERGGIAPGDAARVAALARGDADRAFALAAGEESERDAVASWFFAAAAGEAVEPVWANRGSIEDGLALARALARDWLALRLTGPEAPLLAPDQAERLMALPPREPADLARTVAELGEAERMARTNVSPALVADAARIALAPRGR